MNFISVELFEFDACKLNHLTPVYRKLQLEKREGRHATLFFSAPQMTSQLAIISSGIVYIFLSTLNYYIRILSHVMHVIYNGLNILSFFKKEEHLMHGIKQFMEIFIT